MVDQTKRDGITFTLTRKKQTERSGIFYSVY